jgi:orotidine-5'-phosphate decarboxylase
MGLMSNPEYRLEINFQNENERKLYEHRTLEALECGVDGFVLGATYPPESKEVLNFLKITKEKSLYLVVGVGAQGGSIKNLQSWGVDFKRCLFSLSRTLLFPKQEDFASQELPARQRQAAQYYQRLIQNLRS